VGPTAYVGLSPIILSGGEGAEPSAGIDVFGPTGTGPRGGEALAEWLEVRITAPDGTVSTARRSLFDRVGDMARLKGQVDPAAVRAVELVDLDADHPAEFLPLTAPRFLSVATAVKAGPSIDLPAGQEGLALGIPAQLYHVTRDATNADLSLPRGVAVHLAAPNVAMQVYEPSVASAGTMVSFTETLDLLHRGFGTLPVSGIRAEVPAALLAGVASHVAERLRGGAGLPADLTPSVRGGVSVGSLFEQAAADGIGLRVLHGPLPADLGYPPVAASRLAQALSEGWVAITPKRPVHMGDAERLGWWLVDPITGATRDQMDDGRGSEMAEYGEIIGYAIATALPIICLGGIVTRGYFWTRRHIGSSVGDIPVRTLACGR
jgi:hypothetical protein